MALGWFGRWPELFAFAQILEVFLLKWTHLPPAPTQSAESPNVFFQHPYCQLQMLMRILGLSPLPGVLCMEPAGKASEICGTRE